MTSQNQPPQGSQNSHLTHFDHAGASKMVDVGDKPVSERRAKASGSVRMAPETLQRILNKSFAKGDVLEVARLAGIQAANAPGNSFHFVTCCL